MNTQDPNRRSVLVLLGALTLFVALLSSASPAFAGLGVAATPDFPQTVTVGSSGSASLTIQNASNDAENTVPLTVTDIRLVPACGTVFGAAPDNDCPAASADPGVFTLGATATGQSGACAGATFNVNQNNAATGQVTFAPVGSPVVLQPAGTPGSQDRCVIGFTYTVAAMPTKDSQPGAGGLQTTALGFAAGQTTISGTTVTGSGTGSDSITVFAAVPLSTVATRAANGTISDTATIGPPPAGAPAPAGFVTFDVYGPDDPSCLGTPRFTSTNAVTGDGTAVSNAVAPGPSTGGPGTYRYAATYSGDANYLPTASVCNDANESVDIPAPVIGVVTTAGPLSRVAPGGAFTFTMVVSNPSSADAITITSLTDNMYGNLFGANPGITNNTCGGLQGTTLAPGASAPACSFTGTFTGSAGASQTDIVVVGGMDPNGFTATDNDDATVSITAAGPVVTTGSASAVSGSGASLAGTVNPNGVSTAYVFEYGTGLSFGSISSPTGAGSGSSPVAVSASLTALAAATTYYYRVVATDSGGATAFGTVQSFRTTGSGQAPLALTGAASTITTSGATLNGQVNPKGSQTSYTFEYGTSLTFGQITPVVALDDADALEPVSATLSGLASNTTYYYRTVATNATGTAIGVVASFATGPGGVPVVATGAATGVTATSATLNGSVNPNGWATAYTFEYGPTLTFGSISAVESAGSGQGADAFALPISGLSANTTYLYRIVATNANGTATGQTGSFTTGAGV